MYFNSVLSLSLHFRLSHTMDGFLMVNTKKATFEYDHARLHSCGSKYSDKRNVWITRKMGEKCQANKE